MAQTGLCTYNEKNCSENIIITKGSGWDVHHLLTVFFHFSGRYDLNQDKSSAMKLKENKNGEKVKQ